MLHKIEERRQSSSPSTQLEGGCSGSPPFFFSILSRSDTITLGLGGHEIEFGKFYLSLSSRVPSPNLLLKVNSVLEAHGLGCFQSHIMEHVDARLLLGYKSHEAFGLSLDFTVVGFVLFASFKS